MYEEFGIKEKIEKMANQVQKEIETVFEKINQSNEKNSMKVLNAFQKYHVSEMHFNSSTGYGYGDVGRDTIEKIFAEVLKAEDALVRNQFISGTHALTVCLFGLLRPNDIVLSINGKPYDTLDSVIGIEENASSLRSYGVKYEQIELIENEFNVEKIKERIEEIQELQKTQAEENALDGVDISELNQKREYRESASSDEKVNLEGIFADFNV